jgi:molybdate transport system permease protein
LLIIALLAADAMYVFGSETSEAVTLDFTQDAAGKRLEAGDVVADQFGKFGLTLKTPADGIRAAVLVDSGRPPDGLRALGAPNEAFGGPGQGAGGGPDKPGENAMPLGNVLIVCRDPDTPRPVADPGRIVFEWRDPVRVDEVELLNFSEAGGAVTTYDLEGTVVSEKRANDLGDNSLEVLEVGDEDVARMEVRLPRGGALAELKFTWSGRIRAPWERAYPRLARLIYNPMSAALAKDEIRYSIKLSLLSCTATAILSLWVAIPIGYLLSRHEFVGRNFIDAVLDIPIVLPPLVVGLSLLILFQYFHATIKEAVVYEVPAVILAQFAVACAFAVRTMRATFDQIDERREQVALTLGCSRAQAFGMVVLPEAKRGVLTAATLAWARALGEFGPLLVFAGATRKKTEVLSTTVFLELSIGDLGAAVAVSLIMVVAAVLVLITARLWGTRSLTI